MLGLPSLDFTLTHPNAALTPPCRFPLHCARYRNDGIGRRCLQCYNADLVASAHHLAQAELAVLPRSLAFHLVSFSVLSHVGQACD